MVVSNISARNNVENVRFASSAIDRLVLAQLVILFWITYSFGSEALHVGCVSFASTVSQVSHHHEVN